MRIPHFIHKIITKQKYGLSCCDASNLYDYIAVNIVNGIQCILDNQMGYPAHFKSKEEWLDMLIKIQKGFKEWVINEGYCKYDEIDFKEKELQFKEAMKLFSKYYMYLWN